MDCMQPSCVKKIIGLPSVLIFTLISMSNMWQEIPLTWNYELAFSLNLFYPAQQDKRDFQTGREILSPVEFFKNSNQD